MNTKDEHIKALVEYLLEIRSSQEMEQALRDLLTPSEFSEVTKRLQIFRMLERGVPQRQIAEELGVGIATVTRGSHALRGRQ